MPCAPFKSHGSVGFVCSPTLDRQWIRAGDCPDCKTWTRFICFAYEWYGIDSTCLRCGRHWSDGEWMPLEFCRTARKDNIEAAKKAWRRQKQRAEQAEAEVERLKVCGNCGHFNPSLFKCFEPIAIAAGESGWQSDTRPEVPCHFTPSRWAERGGGT